MNTKNLNIAAMTAVLVLTISAMAFAAPGQGRGKARGCFQQNGAYSQLTPEKRQAVDAIIDKYNVKADELRASIWVKHSVLQAMINGGDANEKKIAGLVADITKLRDQMRDNREAMRAELEKETGIVAFGGRGFRPGQGRGPGMGNGQGPGMGPGMGRGMGLNSGLGQGDCIGAGPCWN